MSEPENPGRRSTDRKELEDKADVAQRNALERHVAMRLTAILKAEDARKKTIRRWIGMAIALFVGITYAFLTLLLLQLQREADETNRHLNETCLVRTAQAKALKNLIDTLTDPAQRPTVSNQTPEQQQRSLEAFVRFEKEYEVELDCDRFFK